MQQHTNSQAKHDIEHLVDTHESAFDVVCALEIIEHVSDRNLFLQSCASLLKVRQSIVYRQNTSLLMPSYPTSGSIIAKWPLIHLNDK